MNGGGQGQLRSLGIEKRLYWESDVEKTCALFVSSVKKQF